MVASEGRPVGTVAATATAGLNPPGRGLFHSSWNRQAPGSSESSSRGGAGGDRWSRELFPSITTAESLQSTPASSLTEKQMGNRKEDLPAAAGQAQGQPKTAEGTVRAPTPGCVGLSLEISRSGTRGPRDGWSRGHRGENPGGAGKRILVQADVKGLTRRKGEQWAWLKG